jgi:hypothetical protein
MIICESKPVTAMRLKYLCAAALAKQDLRVMSFSCRPKLSAKRAIRFPGITAHAKALKVNRATLYRVLTGEWRLPTLSRRYQELLRRAS